MVILRGSPTEGLGQLAESRAIRALGEEGQDNFLPGIGTGCDCLLSRFEGDRLEGVFEGILKEGSHARGEDDGDEEGLPMVKVALLGEESATVFPGEICRPLTDEGDDWLLGEQLGQKLL